VRDASRRGLVPPKDGPNLGSNRPGPAVVLPRERALLRKRDCAARQPVPSLLAGGGTKAKAARWFVTSERSTRNRLRLVVVPVRRRICRSRQNALGLREASHRSRSGRKPARNTELVNGSLTASGAHARKRRGPRSQKGGVSSRLGDPHHVSAASGVMATRFRSCLGANGMRVATDGGRHPRSGMRTPFTRPPRNRSRRPPSHRVEPHAHELGGGDRGARGERYRFEDEGRQRPRPRTTGRRSGKRAVKRGSPQPRLRRTAPSPKTPASRVSGPAEQHAKKTFAWSSTKPQGSGTRATLARGRKASREQSRCAGKRRSTGARVERFRSAEVDRTDLRSRRPGALLARFRTRAT